MTPFDRWLTNEPELPEMCPQCGGDNYTENGEWIAPDHVPFCSAKCEATYEATTAKYEQEINEAVAAEYLDSLSRCVGCFEIGTHAKGCPTGQNGTPYYS